MTPMDMVSWAWQQRLPGRARCMHRGRCGRRRLRQPRQPAAWCGWACCHCPLLPCSPRLCCLCCRIRCCFPCCAAQVFMLPTDAVLDEATLTAIMASGGCRLGPLFPKAPYAHFCLMTGLPALRTAAAVGRACSGWLSMPAQSHPSCCAAMTPQGTAASRCTRQATAPPFLASCWSRLAWVQTILLAGDAAAGGTGGMLCRAPSVCFPSFGMLQGARPCAATRTLLDNGSLAAAASLPPCRSC